MYSDVRWRGRGKAGEKKVHVDVPWGAVFERGKGGDFPFNSCFRRLQFGEFLVIMVDWVMVLD